jgi:hypothetical protein
MQYPTLKQALELRPYSPGHMAAVGGGLAGLTGASIGVLTGDTPAEKRRKALTYGLLGLAGGGGAAALMSANARAGISNLATPAMTPALMAELTQQVSQQAGEAGEAGRKALTERAGEIGSAVTEAGKERLNGVLGQTRFPIMDSLGRLVSPQPAVDAMMATDQIMEQGAKAPSDSNLVWNVIKNLKLLDTKK